MDQPREDRYICSYMSQRKDATPSRVSTQVGIRELNSRLSEYVAAARGGAQVTITVHGKPVAKLISVDDEDPLERLRAAGLLIEPSSPPPQLDEFEPIPAQGSVSELVSEQRR